MNSRTNWKYFIAFATCLGTLSAQQQQTTSDQPSPGGWRKFGDAPQTNASTPNGRGYNGASNNGAPNGGYNNGAPNDAYNNGAPNRAYNGPGGPGPSEQGGPPPQQDFGAPGPLTVPAGTWITVRVNQPLSSDNNQPGDSFTATLAQPLIAEGRVVARRGQLIIGRVGEAARASHNKGTSRLGLELTEATLVDGQQLPIHTQLVLRNGQNSLSGQDAATIGVTTGVGAAIGGAVDGGVGAGIGALAGAAVSTIGVLATRGKPTVVYPETPITFRLEAPLVISTERSAQAFQPVNQQDFNQQPTLARQGPTMGPRYAPAPYYPSYYSPYFYSPYYYGPGFYGPSFYFYSGRGYYGRGWGRRW